MHTLERWEQSQTESGGHPPPSPNLLLYLQKYVQLDCLYEQVAIRIPNKHNIKTSHVFYFVIVIISTQITVEC